MDQTLRILLVTPYDLAVPSGVNQQALGIARGLKEDPAFQVHLLGSLSDPHSGDPSWEGWVTTLGKIHNLPFNGARSRFSLTPSIFPKVRKFLRSWKPDVIHLQEPFAPLLNYAVLRYADVPVLGTFHTFSETSRGYFWGYPFFRLLFRRLDCRTVVSPAAQVFVEKYFKSEYIETPNGIPFPKGAHPWTKQAVGVGPLRLLFIGRWEEPRKGFSLLAEALGNLERRYPGQMQCAVVGPGEAASFYSRFPQFPFRWLGSLSEERKAAAIRESHLVVVPSVGGESFGLVPLEAMAEGRPVLTFSIVGYRQWMSEENAGWVAGEPGVSGLETALETVLAQREQLPEKGSKAREIARTYAWEAILPRWKQIYRDLQVREGVEEL